MEPVECQLGEAQQLGAIGSGQISRRQPASQVRVSVESGVLLDQG
jgi:hypothetical protein